MPQQGNVRTGESSGSQSSLERTLTELKRRLAREATAAVGMLESALDALWKMDVEAAREVRGRDDSIDREEVAIEQECFKLLALEHPFARDFRVLAFILKVNADVERVADHASSVAKVTPKLKWTGTPQWPTALKEMGQRVPIMCHQLMRALLDEDAALARRIVEEDETIDELEKRLFDEVAELMRQEPGSERNGLLLYRVGRELERIGDLMQSIAEDVVYLATGEIVRHEKKRTAAKPG